MVKRYQNPKLGVKQNLVSFLGGLILLLSLATSIFFINALQMLSLVLLPFSKKKFRYLNRTFANLWWGFGVFVMERGYGMKFIFTGDQPPASENVISFSNHQGMVDITTLMPLAWRKKRLGDLKFFVKDILKFVPGPGWGMFFLDCIFVKRNWHADRKMIDRTFTAFVDEKVPIWLISFLEGTRLTEQKLLASQEYAKSQNMKPLQHVLVPRTKGFVGAVIGLRDHVDAVYDFTIGYPDGVPTLWQLIKGFPRVFHVHIDRFPIAEIPTGESEIAEWVLHRYEHKDILLEHFYSSGGFPGNSFDEPYEMS